MSIILECSLAESLLMFQALREMLNDPDRLSADKALAQNILQHLLDQTSTYFKTHPCKQYQPISILLTP